MATKAAAKTIEGNTQLVTEILELTDRENDLAVELKKVKAEREGKTKDLSDISMDIFKEDIGDTTDDRAPEVFGNHEYQSGSRIITVNFKMKPGGFSLTEISGHKACDALPKMLGDKDYKKLFTETQVLDMTADDLEVVHTTRPDLVGHRLDASMLPEKELEALRDKYPQAFTPYVKDEAKFIEEIPGANVETKVTTATGFIGKVEKLDEEPRQKLRNLFRKIFDTAVTTAVKCGNKASA